MTNTVADPRPPTEPEPAPTDAPTTTKTSLNFLRLALAQRGDTYETNTPGDLTRPDPSSFDCSGLVTWAAVQCGYPVLWPGVGDWSWSIAQIQICERAGTTLTVQEAKQTAGALLFRRPTGEKVGHVAISLGNGSLMHAMSKTMGVNVSTAAPDEDYDLGGFLPDMLFTGPISGLPTGRRGEGPPKTGGGFRGAMDRPERPIGAFQMPVVIEAIAVDQATGPIDDEIVVIETVTVKEVPDMLFLARLDTNPNLWMRGNGVHSSRIRAANIDEVLELLVDPDRGPVYHDPVAPGCPIITSVDAVPLLTAEQLVAHLGDESVESNPS